MFKTEFNPEFVELKKPKEYGSLKVYIELFLEVVLFVFFVNTFLLQTYVIPSQSMENSMLVGDHLVVDKVSYSHTATILDRLFLPQYKIERGMIVTFNGPYEINRKEEPKNLVKRVIGLPGDTIKLIGNRVYINEKPVVEPYTCFKGFGGVPDFPPENSWEWRQEFPKKYMESVVDTAQGKAFLVPKGHYFCMGDNRNNSFDCRCWGPVPEDYIVGRPWIVYWSYNSDTDEYVPLDFTDKIKDIIGTVGNFFTRTRWDRTFKKY